ncbi:gamma-cadinene synthase [Phtheirospermum japonicum]|uniref:Gamma-cadinene synthase n=1 Tax=Phtheirospermum japonicum TaxID=374723 RepID=A0A830CUS9_9LAMI|nr:gamma-cadinene synthase [Phtheirospermum japonicum]
MVLTIDVDVRPPTASFTPSMWGHTFTSFTLDHQVNKKNLEVIEALKEEVSSMLRMAKRQTRGEQLVLIDTLERLGVGYHFDQEIEEQLEQIFKSHCENGEEGDDLFITSLQFRLLRQHRHYVSCSKLSLSLCAITRFIITLALMGTYTLPSRHHSPLHEI